MQRRLTLERLAADAGLSKGFLSEIEHGLALPSLTTLERLAEQLGRPLHELLRLPPVVRKRTGDGRAKKPAAATRRGGRGKGSHAGLRT